MRRIDPPYLDALVATAVAVLVASLFLFIMPPKKKSKKAAAALSPLKAHFEAIDAAIGKNENGLGQMLIRGVLQEDEDEDDDDEDKEEKDQDSYTEEQVSHMRHIVITQRRANALEEMEAVVLGDQADESFMMFTTSFSYEVLQAFDDFFSLLKKKKTAGEKFDYLFAFTRSVQDHDTWMHDHEVGWGGHKPIAKLAKAWKEVLANDNEALGIADDFTRPGIVTMLDEFKKSVEDIEQCDEPDVKFKYA